MIKTSFKESFRLIGRSKPECLVYLVIICLSEVLVFALSKWFGVDYPLRGGKPDPARLAYTLAFSIPGYLFSAWAGAGLIGRISMDALTGAPGAMTGYANGWFLRNLTGSIAVVTAAFLPLLLMLFVPVPLAIVPILGWFVAVIWLAVRLSLWGCIMFMDGLGPFAAMERSFTVSAGYSFQLLILSLPLLAAMLLDIGARKLTGNSIMSSAILKPLFLGAATLVQMGALAAAYISIRNRPASGPDSAAGLNQPAL